MSREETDVQGCGYIWVYTLQSSIHPSCATQSTLLFWAFFHHTDSNSGKGVELLKLFLAASPLPELFTVTCSSIPQRSWGVLFSVVWTLHVHYMPSPVVCSVEVATGWKNKDRECKTGIGNEMQVGWNYVWPMNQGGSQGRWTESSWQKRKVTIYNPIAAERSRGKSYNLLLLIN